MPAAQSKQGPRTSRGSGGVAASLRLRPPSFVSLQFIWPIAWVTFRTLLRAFRGDVQSASLSLVSSVAWQLVLEAGLGSGEKVRVVRHQRRWRVLPSASYREAREGGWPRPVVMPALTRGHRGASSIRSPPNVSSYW